MMLISNFANVLQFSALILLPLATPLMKQVAVREKKKYSLELYICSLLADKGLF